MPHIHFYKPVSYRGFSRLIGWFVCLFSRSFCHTDMSAMTATNGEVVVTADIVEGKVTTCRRTPSSPPPRASFALPVYDVQFWVAAEKFIGQPYSKEELVRAGIPCLSDKDLPGVICSEHVAKMIIELAKSTGTMQVLAKELEEMKPWGKTPRDIYDVVAKHLPRV